LVQAAIVDERDAVVDALGLITRVQVVSRGSLIDVYGRAGGDALADGRDHLILALEPERQGPETTEHQDLVKKLLKAGLK